MKMALVREETYIEANMQFSSVHFFSLTNTPTETTYKHDKITLNMI